MKKCSAKEQRKLWPKQLDGSKQTSKIENQIARTTDVNGSSSTTANTKFICSFVVFPHKSSSNTYFAGGFFFQSHFRLSAAQRLAKYSTEKKGEKNIWSKPFGLRRFGSSAFNESTHFIEEKSLKWIRRTYIVHPATLWRRQHAELVCTRFDARLYELRTHRPIHHNFILLFCYCLPLEMVRVYEHDIISGYLRAKCWMVSADANHCLYSCRSFCIPLSLSLSTVLPSLIRSLRSFFCFFVFHLICLTLCATMFSLHRHLFLCSRTDINLRMHEVV